MTEEKNKTDVNYEILSGEIRKGMTFIASVRVEVNGDSEIFTFKDEVCEDHLTDAVLKMAVEELSTDIDFDYTEAQRFRKEGNNADALVQMFYRSPCTTGQFSDSWDEEYGSSYPSKLRDKGLVRGIGSIDSKTIWTLTPEGVKEALCLIGHPETEQELADARTAGDVAGLNQLFPDDE